MRLLAPPRRTLWRFAAVAITLAIAVLLLLPADSLPSTSVAVSDKVVHGALFLLWALTCRRSGIGAGPVLLVGLVLAVGTEAGQGLMHMGREADVADAAADLVGILLGVLLSSRGAAPEVRSRT